MKSKPDSIFVVDHKELNELMSGFASAEIAKATGLGIDYVHGVRSKTKTGRTIPIAKANLIADACFSLSKKENMVPEQCVALRKGGVTGQYYLEQETGHRIYVSCSSENLQDVARSVHKWVLEQKFKPLAVYVEQTELWSGIAAQLETYKDSTMIGWNGCEIRFFPAKRAIVQPLPPIFSAAELAKAHDEYEARLEARLDQAMVMDKPQGFGSSIRLNTEQPPRDEWTICRELVALLRELRNASKSQVLFENLVQSVSEKVMST